MSAETSSARSCSGIDGSAARHRRPLTTMWCPDGVRSGPPSSSPATRPSWQVGPATPSRPCPGGDRGGGSDDGVPRLAARPGRRATMPTTTYTLEVPGAVLTYDVHQPVRASDHPPLFVFGSPMGASGFAQLVEQLDDRVVLTYDPRMAERSRLTEGGEVSVEIHGEDLHRVVEAAGLGPVDAFGSSGGAQAALPWVVAHPQDVRTLVAHEPPLTLLLPDADILMKVNADIVETYQQRGFGPALAKFMRLVMHTGEFTQEYLDQPEPYPAHYVLPTEVDGSRHCTRRCLNTT